MALLAATRVSPSAFVVRPLQLSAESSRLPIACPVRFLPAVSLMGNFCNMHRGLTVRMPIPRPFRAVGQPTRKSSARRGVVRMAMNDNQGSSGEDMLHADDDFREASVMDAGRIYYQATVPTIFIKMDESDLVLPIVVNPQASQMLMQALKKETGIRPTMYEVIREMCTATQMEVKMVRVTGRVVDTYHARIYLSQPNSNELVSVDAKPSDAINIAVACNVKIFVNKHLMETDGVIPQYKTMWTDFGGHTFGHLLPDGKLDVAESDQDPLAEEIVLIKNMSNAATEERYADAARWRDELQKFRSKNNPRRLHRQV